jgi:adenine-specific DNA-methyltransferase
MALLDRKTHGAYFTRADIADFLVGWAVTSSTTRVLEPSAGEGVFLDAIARRSSVLGTEVQCIAVERDLELAQPNRGIRPLQSVEFVVGDFFEYSTPTHDAFDAVVGNPPWVRAASIPAQDRDRANAACVRSNVRLSATASTWAPFLVHAASMLTSAGRLAMVLPAELLQVDYAATVRTFLQRRFRRLEILRFDEHLFPDATVDAILLLASNDGEPGVWMAHLPSTRYLRTYDRWLHRHVGARWSPFNVEPRAMDLLGDLVASGRYTALGNIANIRIGTVTGNNNYFVLRSSEVKRHRIPDHLVKPVICHPRQLAGGAVDAGVLGELDRADVPLWLLSVAPDQAPLIADYIASGELEGTSSRYKCRTRTPWYSVHLEAPPDLFLAYMSHVIPRLAVNRAGAISTNLVHGIYLADPRQRDRLGRDWLNSATALSWEIVGRTYGGGVLKLEPSEAKRILVPTPTRHTLLTKAEAKMLERSWRARVEARLSRNGGVTPASLEAAA